MTIVRKPEPPAPNAYKPAQTVAEFLAAGGVIQRLPDHHSAQPLRFDHSDTRTPIRCRHPAVRGRGHVST